MIHADNEEFIVDEDMLFYSSLSLVETSEGLRNAITENYDLLKNIVDAEALILNYLSESDGTLFNVKPGRRSGLFILGTIAKGRKFLSLLRRGVARIPDEYPNHSYSPGFRIFAMMAQKHGLEYLSQPELLCSQNEVEDLCKRLNACIADIRKKVRTKSFERSIKGHTRASRKNYRGMKLFVDYLFKWYARLLVIRVDLGYLKQYKWGSNDPLAVSFDECFEHRAQFIRDLPDIVGKDALVAYLWKTEFKLDKTLHTHLVVFLNGNIARQDITIAKMIGEHWKGECTQGRGEYWNVTAEYDRNHPSYCIGMVHASEFAKIEALKEIAIGYLCKPDYYINWIVPKGHRAFGKTVIKEQIGAKRGRPRLMDMLPIDNG